MTALWEVDANGTGLHRLFPETAPWSNGACGNWTKDGKYFVFHAGPPPASNLWLMEEHSGILPQQSIPRQLTFGFSFRGPQPSADGNRLFARTQLYRGEMTKFDLATGRQSLLLHQVMTDMVSYSRDGQWIAYCLSDQEQSLWLSRPDGRNPRQVIPQPIQSAFPQWSPDGKHLAVATRRLGQPWRISLASPGDGTFEELKLTDSNAIHPSWSPDGKQILFGTIPTLEKNPAKGQLYLIDLLTRQVSTVPNSQGLFTPAWSPDGRFMVAIRADSSHLSLFDAATKQWRDLTNFKSGYPVWSPDSRSVVLIRHKADGPWSSRVNVITGAVEDVLHLKDVRLLDRWIGLHPDGSLLAAKSSSVQEIYALELHPGLSAGR